MLKNTLKTTVLLAGLGGLLIAVGGILGGATGATIGLLIALVVVGGSYWFSDKLALKAAAAQIVTEQQAPELYRMVAGLRPAGRPADAGRRHLPRPAAQRLRHGPQPEPRRRVLHAGHPADAAP
jgi:Zn-dependent protease with chaperone function